MAASLAAELRARAEALKARDIPIEKLRRELAGMRRHRFGARPEAIDRIAALYALKAEARRRTPEERVRIRQAKAKPIFDDLGTWLA